MVHARTALAQSDTLRLVWPQWQGAGEASVMGPWKMTRTHWEPGC